MLLTELLQPPEILAALASASHGSKSCLPTTLSRRVRRSGAKLAPCISTSHPAC